jgi:hypothetical protein
MALRSVIKHLLAAAALWVAAILTFTLMGGLVGPVLIANHRPQGVKVVRWLHLPANIAGMHPMRRLPNGDCVIPYTVKGAAYEWRQFVIKGCTRAAPAIPS